jgi:hypothetical protein
LKKKWQKPSAVHAKADASLKRRGGTNDSYENAFKIPYRASSKKRGFISGVQGVSRLGFDTKQDPRQNQMQNLPLKEIVARQLAAAGDKIDFAIMKPLKRKASAARASARGLRDSVSNAYNRMTSAARMSIGLQGHHLEHSKLIPVPKDRRKNFGLHENSAVRLYDLEEKTGNLYERSSEFKGPVGFWPHPRSDEMTAQFLPGHGPEKGQSWAIVTRD